MEYLDFVAFLDDISGCFISGDFELWQSRMILPFSMVTPDGTVVLEDRDQAETNFKLYLLASECMALTHVVRTPRDFSPNKDGSWRGTYETNLIRNGVRMAAPYQSTAVLWRTGGTWKMSKILNARGHYTWTDVKPDLEQLNSFGNIAETLNKPRTKARVLATQDR